VKNDVSRARSYRRDGTPEKFYEMVVEKGCTALLPPSTGPLPPFDTKVTFSYIADPHGGKIELIEWHDMCRGLRTKPAIEGVNHVAFGVSNMERSLKFYRKLGFTELGFEFDGYFDAMAIWFPKLVKMRIALTANYYGAAVELVEQTPPSKDLRGSWGHVGPMEFAVGVSNLEKAYEELQKDGIGFLCPPQTIKLSSGEWKYAYLVDPDNLYVSLIEARC
jgi:catechol 2,3-dioxygenase-like lactoylglutathione lyase family enzyme